MTENIPSPEQPQIPERIPTPGQMPVLPDPSIVAALRTTSALPTQQRLMFQQLPPNIPVAMSQIQLPGNVPAPQSSLPSRVPAVPIQVSSLPIPEPRLPSPPVYPQPGPMGGPLQSQGMQLPERIVATGGSIPNLPQPMPPRNVDLLLPERTPLRLPGSSDLPPIQPLPGGGQSSRGLPGGSQAPSQDSVIPMLEQLHSKIDRLGGRQGPPPMQNALRMPPVAAMRGGMPQEGYAASSASMNVSSWDGLRGAGGWGAGTRHNGGPAQFLEPGRQDPR